MARIGLTLYLMLATAVGPCLCCCTMARLPAIAMAPAAEPPAPPSCCCHGEAPSADPASVDESNPDNSPPASPAGRCPCDKGLRNVLAIDLPERVSEVDRISALASLNPLADGMTMSSLAQRDDARWLVGPINIPFYDSTDMLRAFHMLRC